MNARQQNSLTRWLPAVAAGGLLAAVVAAGVISGGGGDSAPPGTNIGTVIPVESGVTPTQPEGPVENLGAVTDVTAPEVTIPPDQQIGADGAAVEKVPLSSTLGSGMAGPEVERVQERLVQLGFDPGPVDGIFGELTRQSVWAFEKLVMGTHRSEVTGRVTPEMWDRMQDPIKIHPRTPSGGLADHVEIYLPEQVMIVFHADEPAVVTHVSTGELKPGVTDDTPWNDFNQIAAEYCEVVKIDTDATGTPLPEIREEARCGRSYTPPGVFQAYRMIEGRRESALGGMYDPIYINQGIAIHGALNVPTYPASHGCIRVSQYLGEKLQSMIDLGDQVLIYDGKVDPWNQPKSAMQMRFDYPDPNATTTTTSTTTTTTTTIAPTTTAPAPTTTQPATTTTAPSTTTTTTTTAPAANDAGPDTTVEPVDDL